MQLLILKSYNMSLRLITTACLRRTIAAGEFRDTKKKELQQFSNDTGIEITVSHFPPGTSKWNKIEHRLFSFITMNWRGNPLISHEVIVKLIASTCTKKGLLVKCGLDKNKYQKGVKIIDQDYRPRNERDPVEKV